MGMLKVLVRPAVAPRISAIPSVRTLQRQCACAGKCERCKEDKRLQRKASRPDDVQQVPRVVEDVLRSTGVPLDAATRAFMEPRFAQGFGDVRVHSGARAAQAARSVHAHAFTVGRDVVFDSGRYAPASADGRRLLAHELTHVVQQRGAALVSSPARLDVDASDSPSEHEADRVSAAVVGAPSSASAANAVSQRSGVSRVSRASAGAPDAARLAVNLGRTPRTGVQFIPNNIVDTVVGPPDMRGGLLDTGAPRLQVIIGENQNLRTLGVELLPLWLTATPFTPPGAAAPLPLDIITALELAQALLVYNQNYLPVPAMTQWRAGLRLPLPVAIEEATHVATLHPLNIRALASGFDPTWLPLLDQRASATTAPAAAVLQADVGAFLAATPDALGRGIALGARAITNAIAALPFIREAFVQLGAAGFDVALQFMDNLVNREIDLLAAQNGGAGILAQVRTALAAAPAAPTPTQAAGLARASLMLARVAAAPATAAPGAMRTRAEKPVTIDTVKLDGSTRDPAADVATANSIYAQCNVRLVHRVNQTATAADTTAWIGADRVCTSSPCAAASAEERALMVGATARFGLSSRLRAFYMLDISNHERAESAPPYCATGAGAMIRNMIKVTNNSNGRTLAHEAGHVLLNNGNHPANLQRVMGPAGAAPQGETFTDAECSTIYTNA